MPKPDPCKKFACAIQKCLSENGFQESRCTRQIDNLLECCKKYHKISLVCSGMKPKAITEENQKIKVKSSWKRIVMDAVNKAKSRFKRYPELLLTCRVEGLEYAACIIQNEKDLKPNSCKTQFMKFRECLASNALKLSSRI